MLAPKWASGWVWYDWLWIYEYEVVSRRPYFFGHMFGIACWSVWSRVEQNLRKYKDVVCRTCSLPEIDRFYFQFSLPKAKGFFCKPRPWIHFLHTVTLWRVLHGIHRVTMCNPFQKIRVTSMPFQPVYLLLMHWTTGHLHFLIALQCPLLSQH